VPVAAITAGRPARRLLSCAAVFLLGLVLAPPIHGATLRGVVVDPQGAAVASVRVTVVGPLGATSVSTDDAGRFEVPNLAAATYRVLAQADGWQAASQAWTLAGDETRDVDIALTVAGLAESVVVSVSQVEVASADAPASVTVVDRAALQARQSEDLAGALAAVPGLTVSRNGGRGALTSSFPRGGESDYTLLLVDGMRLNAFGGGADLSQLAVGNVERVEVVRGPQSAVYGSDAIGGVVQVVTAASGPPRAESLVEGGSQSTSRALAVGSATTGRWSWSGSAERAASDGYTGLAPANGEPVTNDDSWSRQLAGSATWQRTPDTAVRLHLRSFESERGFPGPYGSNPIGAFPGVDTVSRGDNDNRQAGVTVSHPWGRAFEGRVRQRWTATHGDFDSRFASPYGPSTFETRRTGLRAQTDVAVTATGSLTAGLEGLAERARSTYIVGADAGELPIERSVIGTFAEWRQALPGSVSLTAGLRLERVRRDALEGDPNPFAPRPAFAADTVWSANPRVTVAWAPGRDGATRVHASAGTGIRPPDAFEIAFTDNPGLAPERSRSIEGGVSHTVARGLELGLTAFHNEYDDLIVAVGRSLEDASRYRTDNVSNARARGLEVSGRWRTGAALSVDAAYTFLSTEILAVDRTSQAPPPFAVGDPLIRRPRHQGSLGLVATFGRVTGFVEAGARGRTLDIEPNYGAFGGLFPNAGFVAANAGVTVRLHRLVDVFARGLNLFDRRYEETLGFPALRQSGVAGVRVALGR
jgi:outer membrane cobalamin receptor